MTSLPYYLANQPVHSEHTLPVTDKYHGHTIAQVSLADAATIDQAIAHAVAAEADMAALKPFERKAILKQCVAAFEARFDQFAKTLCAEAGKPLKDARGEVHRLIDTFEVAAEEAVRIHGEVQNLEISTRAANRRGFIKPVPIGACSFITPFNFPLNLVAHKVAPAIAAGCPFVLKPASDTPLGALMIAEVLAETDLPKGAFSILPCQSSQAGALTTDERLKLLSFTGSQDVGWMLKAQAGKKRVILELGGNAACVIDADQGDQLDYVIERCVIGGYYQSGQSCISVQRLYVHESLYEAFKTRFVDAVAKLKHGDPHAEDTFIGPMISEQEAERLHGWIDAARADGATILTGGQRDGAMLTACVLEGVSPQADVYAKEAFGPVTLLEPFADFDAALAKVNDSDFGLQAGVFTHRIDHAMRAWDGLHVGGVVINDVPSWRVDSMPYGGVKDSGLGREGVRYAIEHLTEPRLLIMANV